MATTTPARSDRKPSARTAAKPGRTRVPAQRPVATPPPAAQPEAPRYHHGNLREELVRCGKAMLEQSSLADLSLRGIAAGVGVSQVAPKHHFGNKEGLLAAIAASGFRDLTEFRFSRLRPNMNAEQRLRTLLSAYVTFATQKPALFHLMFAPQFKTPELHAELNEAASNSYRILARGASEYFAELGGAQSGISPEEAARVAWMSMHGVATLLIEHRINPLGAAKITRDQLVNQMLDVVFAGLREMRKQK
jgi:AcrR family transcriptional regulator